MALALLVAAFSGWIFLPVPGLTASIPPPDRAPALNGLPWLSTRGNEIVDSAGRAVMLRGFNTNTLLEPTVWPAPLDTTDATLMQQSGFDVVRLPIAWSLLEPHRGHYDASYLDRITAVVTLLNEHGLYVVLDMHFLGWSPVYGGSGAPAWATVSQVPDPVWGPMPSLGRFLSPAINVSTANFWLSSPLQQDFIDAWSVVAERFREDSGVAGYDLINEPHSFPLPPLLFDKDQLFPFYARAVSRLGATDPNHLFFLDNDMTGDLPTAAVPLSAPNIVYAPHVYTGSLIPPLFSGDPAPLRDHIAELVSEARTLPAPVWFGEFSIDVHGQLAPQWINDILGDFDQQEAGWAWWQWRESSGYGVRSADASTIDRELLDLLDRPYVIALPMGVSRDDAIPSDVHLRVRAVHDASPIEVAWPGTVLGKPNVRSDCGARFSWKGDTARLILTPPVAGACSIDVTT
ncbi:MAG: glycoside hydrolase family 5 protein [Candidatus Dormibacteria bacterium]